MLGQARRKQNTTEILAKAWDVAYQSLTGSGLSHVIVSTTSVYRNHVRASERPTAKSQNVDVDVQYLTEPSRCS